jgi:hypothetical protein
MTHIFNPPPALNTTLPCPERPEKAADAVFSFQLIPSVDFQTSLNQVAPLLYCPPITHMAVPPPSLKVTALSPYLGLNPAAQLAKVQLTPGLGRAVMVDVGVFVGLFVAVLVRVFVGELVGVAVGLNVGVKSVMQV